MDVNSFLSKYAELSDDEIYERIMNAKAKLGDSLCILGHYYQRDSIVQFADEIGDSFQLAKAGSQTDAKYIIFCGVNFMAEVSVVLAKSGQRVLSPNPDAGCPLADFANVDDVETAWREIESAGMSDNFMPITYVNSSAAVKAFCGRNGGMACTSSSSGKAFTRALDSGKRIFFMPDENLGRNTANALDIPFDDVVLWDPEKKCGGLSHDGIKQARVIVWKGYCHVHTFFSANHVKSAREKYPECEIIVHPESVPEIVDMADGSGSTAYIKRFVHEASTGSTIVVGTEINMVSRLATEYEDRRIVPLTRSLCPNMFKISPKHLCAVLEHIDDVEPLTVDKNIAHDARTALERMLTL